MTDYYYFVIGPDARREFAVYTHKYHMNSDDCLKTVMQRLIKANLEGWSPWQWPQGGVPKSDLDLCFDSDDAKVLIFQIAEPSAAHHHTQFAKKDPLETLKINGFRNAKVIQNAETFDDANSDATWAYAEIDPKRSRREVDAEHSDYNADGAEIINFPFAFNFVDHRTGVSPVLKTPPQPLAAPLFNDGRIHPRSPANMVTILGGGG